MITFKTENIDEEIENWEFDTIEEILKEWWTNDGENLPFGEDGVVDGKFMIDNREYVVIDFSDIIAELSIIYWSEVII